MVGLILRNLDVVFFTIMLCSVIAVTLIIKGFLQVRASVMIPESSTQTMREMIANRQFKELLEFTEKDDTFVSHALNPALKRAPSFQAMKEALETSIGEETAEQFRKIEYLNIIGNLGPLLGLLGTVMGDDPGVCRSGGGQWPGQCVGTGWRYLGGIDAYVSWVWRWRFRAWQRLVCCGRWWIG